MKALLGEKLSPQIAVLLRDAGYDARAAVTALGSIRTCIRPSAVVNGRVGHRDQPSSWGLRDRSEISLVMPLGAPIPPSKQASEALLAAFAERHIEWRPNQLVVALDPATHVATTADGDQFAYDLFLVWAPRRQVCSPKGRLELWRRRLSPACPVKSRRPSMTGMASVTSNSGGTRWREWR